MEDSKWQPQFIIIKKTPRQLEMYSEPSKASKIELFTNIVDCIQLLTIFAKHSILGVSQVRYASGKTKEKLTALSFNSQKIRTAISADFFYF